MKTIALALFVSLSLYAAPISESRFDSPGMVPMQAVISDGVIESSSDDDADIVEEVRSQLYYLVGPHFHDASPALNHDFHVEIGEREGTRVSYHARFLWAWDTGAAPAQVDAILPARGDADGLAEFSKKYSAKCGGDWDGFFWYNYNPALTDCALKGELPDDAVKLRITLATLPMTTDKAPPYDTLWKDGKLRITFVAGNTNVRPSDEAASLFRQLKTKFGDPISSQDVKLAQATLHTGEFKTPAGMIFVDAFGITDGNIQSVDEDFLTRLRASTRQANVVAYNGHAGHGANVQAFTAAVQLDPSHFYLVWINACNPFVYLDEPLFESGAPMHLMTIAHVGWFASGGDIARLATELVDKKKTYRQILTGLHQSGVVLGEER